MVSDNFSFRNKFRFSHFEFRHATFSFILPFFFFKPHTENTAIIDCTYIKYKPVTCDPSRTVLYVRVLQVFNFSRVRSLRLTAKHGEVMLLCSSEINGNDGIFILRGT